MNHPKQNSVRIQQQTVRRHVHGCDADTFFNLLTSDELLPCVDAALPEHRERLYSPTATLSMFMTQALHSDGSCQQSVDEFAVNRLLTGLTPCSTGSGAYCRARGRLSTDMIASLVRTTGATHTQTAACRWRGRSVKLIDGTTLSMPDTPGNQARFPQQASQAAGLGFPLARVVAVLCLGSGAALDAAIGPYQGKLSGEHALLRSLLTCFQAGDIAVADCYYASYFLIAALIARDVDVLFEQHAARHTDFRRGEKLGAKDHVVQWCKPQQPDWMSAAEYAACPATLTLREVQVQGKVLVTTLRCPNKMPRRALGELYIKRWHVELDLRNIKTTLGMEILSCKTPAMVIKELWVYLLAYNLIRLLMTEAARHSGIASRDISFKHTVQVWLACRYRHLIAFAHNLEQRMLFYRLVASQRVGDRPGRIEPRAVKRRPKPYPLLMLPRAQARAKILRHGHPAKLK